MLRKVSGNKTEKRKEMVGGKKTKGAKAVVTTSHKFLSSENKVHGKDSERPGRVDEKARETKKDQERKKTETDHQINDIKKRLRETLQKGIQQARACPAIPQ